MEKIDQPSDGFLRRITERKKSTNRQTSENQKQKLECSSTRKREVEDEKAERSPAGLSEGHD